MNNINAKFQIHIRARHKYIQCFERSTFMITKYKSRGRCSRLDWDVIFATMYVYLYMHALVKAHWLTLLRPCPVLHHRKSCWEPDVEKCKNGWKRRKIFSRVWNKEGLSETDEYLNFHPAGEIPEFVPYLLIPTPHRPSEVCNSINCFWLKVYKIFRAFLFTAVYLSAKLE
jgi:hypothetical protein